MKLSVVFVLANIILPSCFLFKDYKKKGLVYNENGQSKSATILVPKGFLKQESVDTAGVTIHTYYYTGGAILYTAYLTDTTTELQPIDKTIHQPLYHRLGGLVYKGQDDKSLYYREIQQGHLRFGYRFVPEVLEFQFDSATNYASLQKH